VICAITNHKSQITNRRLLLFDGSDLALPIKAAMRANAMRSFRLVALRAQVGGGSAQRIVCAAL